MRKILLFFLITFFLESSELSLEEKVGQMLVTHIYGQDLSFESETLITDLHLGGVIYYQWSNGLISQFQVKNLSKKLQKSSKIPLFIMVDQEGGVVSRLQEFITVFPGNRALGSILDLELARKSALFTGQQLRSLGINFNLAPVVDISRGSLRSFSLDSDDVISLARAQLLGYQEAGVFTCLKHFPGLGKARVDTHEKMAIVETIEMEPFLELEQLADSVMTAHVLVPNIDLKNCATLSSKILGLLSKNTLIVSDSLAMKGVLENAGSPEEAALQAVQAGCNLLILGGKLLSGEDAGFELTPADVRKIHKRLVEAVRQNEIDESFIDQSVQKILSLKDKIDLESEIHFNQIEHQELAFEIATKSLKVIASQDFDFKNKSFSVYAQDDWIPMLSHTLLRIAPKKIGDILPVEKYEVKKSGEIPIVFAYNAYADPKQIAKINLLIDSNIPFILVVMGNLDDLDLFGKAPYIVVLHSPVNASLQAVSRFILNLF